MEDPFADEESLKFRTSTLPRRQNSLIRPERNNFNDKQNPHYHYFQKAKHQSYATNNSIEEQNDVHITDNKNEDVEMDYIINNTSSNTGFHDNGSDVDIDFLTNEHETLLKRSNAKTVMEEKKSNSWWSQLWLFYCYLITFWAPASVMSKVFGLSTKERQLAWRDKIALISAIMYLGAFIAYLTFGFSRTVCSTDGELRLKVDQVISSYFVINGQIFDLASSSHPEAPGLDAGANVLYPPINGAAKSGSFLFQNVNGYCHNLILPTDESTIPHDDDNNLSWYFPCKIIDLYGTTKPNFTESEYYDGYACHTSEIARDAYYNLKKTADLYFTWDDIKNDTRKLAVYNGNVLDLGLLDWLNPDQLVVPKAFDDLKSYSSELNGYDLSIIFTTEHEKTIGNCLSEIIKVGEIDSESIGCIASSIVLYISLVFILAIVVFKFLIACYYHHIVAKAQGIPNNPDEAEKTYAHCMTMSIQKSLNESELNENPFLPVVADSMNPLGIHPDSIQQPPLNYKPFGLSLLHTICFVTCYSEDEAGLRITLDSIATTNYPHSHKLIVVACDGMIKGSDNDSLTSDIVLDMMENFVVPRESVQAYSYVAVASGAKRHNMAKIYAGFYKYDEETVPESERQQIPMIVIVKCGTPDEQGSAKPGNRGKRDSQVILMNFLQKITFNERMSELEYQLLKNIWRITGLMADVYESVLMVDADTKVYVNSLSHMISELVKDPEIIALCGETKIANKAQSWVTAIQVFEYFISHHQAKAFETVFGTVTCLPGCFSVYRIKSPKDNGGYWVPILANPDIVEKYSDNVTDTLHKKNLLLLGEDRYLSSLMLKTFPKRKQVFVKKASCKTVVPDKFKVLLSQRRRWINSTVHNLFELVFLKDLCGVFCFSMQFVIMIELIGALVLPVAISFTFYVIIFAIVSHPTPVITLVLLGIVQGLPGCIIVVTASQWSYLGWMVIYLLALPVWNFVLPSYAYWKFDDFSWGETRLIAGGNTHQEEEEGEFDHSKIKMKTWQEFEKLDVDSY